MKIASWKTLNQNSKIRRRYAFTAIERDMFSSESEICEKAEKAFINFGFLKKEDLLSWATREQEYKSLKS